MKFWDWDPSLNLGIDMIDSQHRQLVEFINELGNAHTSKNDFLVSKTLIGLLDYTITHFAFEEKLMELGHYPLTEAHKEAHAAFAARVQKYYRQHESGRDILEPLMSELKLWLTQHIRYEDSKFVPYVKPVPKNWIEGILARFFGSFR